MNVPLEFLRRRAGPDGTPIVERLGMPVLKSDGWIRLELLLADDSCFTEGWERAWHGCKFEALYSIIYNGQLYESRSRSRGERMLAAHEAEGAPGVYLHKDGTQHKAENYMRFVQLCGDSIFWAAIWEVRVKRADRIDRAAWNTDQWVQPARSVRLVALWLCGRNASQMRQGDEVAVCWKPELEAHPTARRDNNNDDSDKQVVDTRLESSQAVHERPKRNAAKTETWLSIQRQRREKEAADKAVAEKADAPFLGTWAQGPISYPRQGILGLY